MKRASLSSSTFIRIDDSKSSIHRSRRREMSLNRIQMISFTSRSFETSKVDDFDLSDVEEFLRRRMTSLSSDFESDSNENFDALKNVVTVLTST